MRSDVTLDFNLLYVHTFFYANISTKKIERKCFLEFSISVAVALISKSLLIL